MINTVTRHKWQSAIMLDPRLTRAAVAVAAALEGFHNRETDKCNPLVSTIGKACGLQPRSVRDAVAQLEECGYLERDVRPGRSHANSYRFNWENRQDGAGISYGKPAPACRIYSGKAAEPRPKTGTTTTLKPAPLCHQNTGIEHGEEHDALNERKSAEEMAAFLAPQTEQTPAPKGPPKASPTDLLAQLAGQLNWFRSTPEGKQQASSDLAAVLGLYDHQTIIAATVAEFQVRRAKIHTSELVNVVRIYAERQPPAEDLAHQQPDHHQVAVDAAFRDQTAEAIASAPGMPDATEDQLRAVLAGDPALLDRLTTTRTATP